MANAKFHFYMGTVRVHHIVPADEETGRPAMAQALETNILFQNEVKKITADTVDTIRQITLLKCEKKYNIGPDTVADFIIQNIVYFGFMTEAEYLGSTQPTRIE